WIVANTNRFKAAITLRSTTNWITMYGVSAAGPTFPQYALGLNKLDDVDKLWELSPLKYVEDIETPILIMHGEQDLICDIEQAEQFYTALKHLDKDVELVRFPGANHNLSRSGDPLMRIGRLEYICEWFERYI